MVRHAAWIAAVAFAVPAVALAQNANVWNGKDHEVPAGTVRHDEASAGVAPQQQQVRQQDQTLGQLNQQLTARTNRDVQATPLVGRSIYGVTPNGTVPITPNAGANGAAGAAGAR